jgi:hypothetical protein
MLRDNLNENAHNSLITFLGAKIAMGPAVFFGRHHVRVYRFVLCAFGAEPCWDEQLDTTRRTR